jgi:hypothetical protein
MKKLMEPPVYAQELFSLMLGTTEDADGAGHCVAAQGNVLTIQLAASALQRIFASFDGAPAFSPRASEMAALCCVMREWATPAHAGGSIVGQRQKWLSRGAVLPLYRCLLALAVLPTTARPAAALDDVRALQTNAVQLLPLPEVAAAICNDLCVTFAI